MKNKSYILILLAIPLIILLESCNPFAPTLSVEDGVDLVISDQKTVAGVFQNFDYAYRFKDTLVYSGLLADDFIFTYNNFDRGDSPSWNREMDMAKTYMLFQAAYKIELFWNEAWSEVEYEENDTLYANVNRRFTLTVYYSPTLYDNVYGNAFFKLTRLKIEDPWKIVHWDDQSV